MRCSYYLYIFADGSSVESESRRLGEDGNVLNKCGIERPNRIVFVTWFVIVYCIDIDRRHVVEDDQWQC